MTACGRRGSKRVEGGRRASISLSGALAVLAALVGTAAAQQSDVPKNFTVRELPKAFTRREAMIPMRDGVKLRTVL